MSNSKRVMLVDRLKSTTAATDNNILATFVDFWQLQMSVAYKAIFSRNLHLPPLANFHSKKCSNSTTLFFFIHPQGLCITVLKFSLTMGNVLHTVGKLIGAEQFFLKADRERISNAIRDGGTFAGNALKESLRNFNSDSLHQSVMDSAKQLADEVRDGAMSLGNVLSNSLRTFNSNALHQYTGNSAAQLADSIKATSASLGSVLKNSLLTINNETMHQSAIDAAKQLGDSFGSNIRELADAFYWRIVLTVLLLSISFIVAAVYCGAKAVKCAGSMPGDNRNARMPHVT